MNQLVAGIFATKSGGFLGPIANLLGYLMNWIFEILDNIGIPNIGLSIIIFTLIIYIVMTPLTIKQQKFSKLSAKMNPEIQKIRDKYKGRNDNVAMAAMQEETQAVYAKYGVSPTGSCAQLLIQMPILFALYRVISAVPAYVTQVRDSFFPLVDSIAAYDKVHTTGNVAEFLSTLKTSAQYARQFTNEGFTNGLANYISSASDKVANASNVAANVYIDCLNKMSSGGWDSLISKFSGLSNDAIRTKEALLHYNSFLGINIANSPSYIMVNSFGVETAKEIFSNLTKCNFPVFFVALMIPVLAAGTQWLNLALMPQMNNSGNDSQDSMMASMKTMNMMMPIMSFVFCLSLPAGMGIYWIAGAVIRTVQQILINKHLDKMNVDTIIEQNKDKYQKKLDKIKESGTVPSPEAAKKVRYITRGTLTSLDKEKEEAVVKAREYFESNAEPGGIAEKALSVKRFNEKMK